MPAMGSEIRSVDLKYMNTECEKYFSVTWSRTLVKTKQNRSFESER